MTRISRRVLLAAGCAAPFLASCATAGLPSRYRTVRVSAPFAMPPIAEPDFSASPRFPITDFGADPNDQQVAAILNGLKQVSALYAAPAADAEA